MQHAPLSHLCVTISCKVIGTVLEQSGTVQERSGTIQERWGMLGNGTGAVQDRCWNGFLAISITYHAFSTPSSHETIFG